MTPTDLLPRLEAATGPSREPVCKDFDQDCFGLDHVHCWLYDPSKGRCPFLTQQEARDD